MIEIHAGHQDGFFTATHNFSLISTLFTDSNAGFSRACAYSETQDTSYADFIERVSFVPRFPPLARQRMVRMVSREGVMPVLTHGSEVAFLVIGREQADFKEGIVDLGVVEVLISLKDGPDFA